MSDAELERLRDQLREARAALLDMLENSPMDTWELEDWKKRHAVALKAAQDSE
jgi:hypothetical protein